MKINVKWEGELAKLKASSYQYDSFNTSGSSLDKSSDEFAKDDNDLNKLRSVQRTTLAVPLEECVDQLLILKDMIPAPTNPSWIELLEYQTLIQRMEMSPERKRQLAEQEYEKIPFTYKHKLKKELCFLCTTLTETCNEIISGGSFKVFQYVVYAIEQQVLDSNNVLDIMNGLEDQLKEINRTIVEEKHRHFKAMIEASELIAQLKNSYQDIIGHSMCEVRYTDSWEDARRSQLIRTLKKRENVFNNIIDKNNWHIECEQRMHTEIENYINENTEDYQNAIQEWMNLYDHEIERRDAEILDLKMRWETLTEKHQALTETYRQRAIEIEEYLAVKEVRRQQEELERSQNWAATKIQAWWRGVMVRKKLGPYRKKKKKEKIHKRGGKGIKKK